MRMTHEHMIPTVLTSIRLTNSAVKAVTITPTEGCLMRTVFEITDDFLVVQHSICRGSTPLHCLLALVLEYV